MSTSGRPLRLLGVAVVAVVAHLPALRAGWVLDDDVLLVSNPFVRTVAGLRVLLTSELFAASAQPQNVPYYRPLTGALYWVSWHLFGANAAAQHALNLTLHAAVAVALLLTLEAFGVSRRVAFFSTVLFAVHPGTADTVAYVGGRQDLAGWIVVLAALAFLTRAESTVAVAATCFGATFAAASFREFFSCAAIVLAVGATGAAPARGTRHRRVLAAIGGATAAILALALLRRIVDVQPFATDAATPLTYFEATAGVALRLAKDVFAPTDLAVYVSVPPVGLATALVVFGAFAALAVLLDRAIVRRAPSVRTLAWCGLAVAAATASMHGAVALKYGSISDRYAYDAALSTALVGAAAFEAVGAKLAASIEKGPLEPLLRVLPAVIAVALVPLTWSRDAAYRDEAALQTAMSTERPDDPESRLAEGFRLFARGELEAAYPHCAAYAVARPASDRANLCIGTWLVVHARGPEAVPLLRVYALARPGDPRARRTLLASLFATGDLVGVEGQLADWEPMFPGAEELEEAREEVRRRHAASTPK